MSPLLGFRRDGRSTQARVGYSPDEATRLGKSALQVARAGYYINQGGQRVDLLGTVKNAKLAKMSMAPNHPLPAIDELTFGTTEVQVTNETTLMASRRLMGSGLEPLALNFANGVRPGGGFLYGARAQEEVLCRSSALYETLVDDPMYDHHRERPLPDATDWLIYSPAVPVFRNDDGTEISDFWLLNFVTCAAPYAPRVGQPMSGDLLQRRIRRVLEVARAFRQRSLVLGAWGCGAFANDPHRTARDFRHALENEFSGAFSKVVFAITDWSPERKFLGPFRDIFAD